MIKSVITPEHDFNDTKGTFILGVATLLMLVNYLCTPGEQGFFLSAPKCRQSQMSAVHVQRFR